MDSNIEFFSNVTTATLADAATALGLNLFMEGPRPAVPEAYPHIAGPASTMVFAPVNASGSKASHSLYDLVEDVPAGSVMIVDAANSSLAAWGGNVSGACVRRDVAGAAIDGAPRDAEELRDLNFPVFCRSIWSMGFPRLLEVVAQEVLREGLVWQLGPTRPLGRTPLIRIPMEKGSYLLTLKCSGKRDTRYPIFISRGVHWDSGPNPIRLFGDLEIGEDFVYIPSGPFLSGGDPIAPGGLESSSPWEEGFLIAAAPVTMRAW